MQEETLNDRLQRFDDEIDNLKNELSQAKATIAMLKNKPEVVMPEQLTKSQIVAIFDEQPKQDIPKGLTVDQVLNICNQQIELLPNQLTKSQIVAIFDEQPKQILPKINTLTAGDIVRIFNEQQKKTPVKKAAANVDISEKIKEVVNLNFINKLYGKN